MYVATPYGRVHIGNYQELFHEKLGSKQKTRELNEIYITSASGIGKTSYGKRMAMAWCQAHDPLDEDQEWFDELDLEEMKRFEFFFFIPLRDIKRLNSYIDDMISQEIISDLAGGHNYEVSNFLQEILRQHRCLIFLDGLDEYTSQAESPLNQASKIPKRKVRNNCTYITTTRPWKLENVRLTKKQIERKVEMCGLNTESADRLIELVIAKLKDAYGLEKDPEDCKTELKLRKLEGFKSIPIVLLQLICLWYAGKPLGSSQCEVYSNMLELLFSRANQKYPGTATEGDGDPIMLPGCFEKHINCRKNQTLLISLGKLSFNALFRGSLDSPYVINKSFVVPCNISEAQLQYCHQVGILTQVKVEDHILGQEQSFSFLHQTFQEFLAGLYISTTSLQETSKILSNTFRSVADIVEMSTIFTVISGLRPAIISNLVSSLGSILVEDPCIGEYMGGIDHGDTNFNLKRLQSVMLDCLKESQDNGHGNLKLYLVCIFIRGGCQQPPHHLTNLKRILIDNAYTLKAIDIVNIDEDTVNELQLVQSINTIEKISIHDCKLAELVQGLICKSANNLSCLQIRTVSPGTNFLSALENCHNLRSLSVWDVLLEHESFESLATFLSASKQMKQIELRSIECATENGQAIQCEGHHIDLSSHTELETFDTFDTKIFVNGLNTQNLTYCALRSFPSTEDIADVLLLLKNSSKLKHLICTNLANIDRINQILPTLMALKHLEVLLSTKELPTDVETSASSVQISRNMTSLETVTLQHFRMTKASFHQFVDGLLDLEQKVTVHLGDRSFISTDDFKGAIEIVESNPECKVIKTETDGKIFAFNTTERRFAGHNQTKTTNNESKENDKSVVIINGKNSYINNFRKVLIIILGIIFVITITLLAFSSSDVRGRDL
ncbi:uncharacterized protein LOC123549242 [Mercenaria mercenaria]|uniref:uncharacterized protein LOC123549242 n=1 Tax=Mercenaria mercenaria TaxID=6596 RepID=UPI00234ED174|nr:uncharacterized protein LOC123549242 [Mercenaria mercenaria]